MVIQSSSLKVNLKLSLNLHTASIIDDHTNSTKHACSIFTHPLDKKTTFFLETCFKPSLELQYVAHFGEITKSTATDSQFEKQVNCVTTSTHFY